MNRSFVLFGLLCGAGVCFTGCAEVITGTGDLCDGVMCDDGNECTTGECNSVDGLCGFTPVTDGSPCSGGDCQGGTCIVGAFPCTERGILDAIAAGGGPYAFDCDGPTTVDTTANIVIGKDVTLDGGGDLTIAGANEGLQTHRVFSVAEDTTVELIGITVTKGDPTLSGNLGGGILNEGTLTLRDCGLDANGVADDRGGGTQGGGIYSTGTLTMINCTVANNTALSAGGIYNSGEAMITETSIESNSAMRNGSGVYNAGTMTLIETTIAENFEINVGDTAALSTLGDTTLIGSAIWGNLSAQSAGISATGGNVTLVNSTVSGNGANYSAGTSGIEQFNASATLRLISSTILASGRAWAVRRQGSLISTNSILAQEMESQIGVCEGGGTTTSGGGNVESPEGSCGFNQPTDLELVTTAGLALQPLGDNGGPTKTHALGNTSEALDRIPVAACLNADGQALSTDQRGEPRPVNALCDSGAYELQN